jgi:hypothetical protein
VKADGATPALILITVRSQSFTSRTVIVTPAKASPSATTPAAGADLDRGGEQAGIATTPPPSTARHPTRRCCTSSTCPDTGRRAARADSGSPCARLRAGAILVPPERP